MEIKQNKESNISFILLYYSAPYVILGSSKGENNESFEG